MLLAYNEIVTLLDEGVVTRASHDRINSSSLDIILGSKILAERPIKKIRGGGDPQPRYNDETLEKVVLRDRDQLNMTEFDLLRDGPFHLYPGEFILAHSEEIFHLPYNISAKYALKSSMARIGLEHLNAGWCDAGWHGSVLTLELKNVTRNHVIVLHAGDKIGQMIFWEHSEVPHEKSYAARGNYNKDRTVMGAKRAKHQLVFGDAQQENFQEVFNETHIVEEEAVPKNVLDISE